MGSVYAICELLLGMYMAKAALFPSMWPIEILWEGTQSIHVLKVVFERVGVIVFVRRWYDGALYGGMMTLEVDFQQLKHLTTYSVWVG